VPSSVIGGAMLPHAPQFFTTPETEDRATVARVKEVAREIGSRLKALKPDLWIIFANDRAEQFFHNVAPAFTVHVGCSASGSFVGRPFHWRCRAKPASKSCGNCTARVSTPPSPARPR
jgi:2,3-dihydroxyphenylpropionate 1,2-dioxygenase